MVNIVLLKACRQFIDLVCKDHPEIQSYEDFLVPEVRRIARIVGYFKRSSK